MRPKTFFIAGFVLLFIRWVCKALVLIFPELLSQWASNALVILLILELYLIVFSFATAIILTVITLLKRSSLRKKNNSFDAKKETVGKPIAFLLMCLVVLISAGGMLWIVNPFSEASKNERSFEQAVLSLSKDVTEVALNDLVSFEWDYVYRFHPYASNEEIYSVIGFEADQSLEILNDNLNSLVFVKDTNVVCNLAWFSSDTKYSFNLNEGATGYVQIKKLDNPIFKLELKNGIRYFTLAA